MKTETLIVVHEHDFGISTYNAIVPEGYKPEPEELIEEFDIDFDEDKETLMWNIDPTPKKIKKIGFKENECTESETTQEERPKKKVHIKPYDDEMGASWEILFGDEVVEDGFQSTADAEEWAMDHGYEVVYQEEQEWNVPIMRTGYSHTLIAVSARSESEAIAKAIDEAGSESFSESSSEYDAPDGAMIIK